MESVNYRRPHRSVVFCKAKMQLLQVTDAYFEGHEINEALLKELAATLFQSKHYQTLYRQCKSKQEAVLTDQQLVSELVETYQRMLQRQQESVVQKLNALL